MPIQSEGIITRGNVSVDVSAVAYFWVVDATKSVEAIENVEAPINQIAQTALPKVVGQHTLDETLAEADRINVNIRAILDVPTQEWGMMVTLPTQNHPAPGDHEAGHGPPGAGPRRSGRHGQRSIPAKANRWSRRRWETRQAR